MSTPTPNVKQTVSAAMANVAVAADDPRARAAKRAAELRAHNGALDEGVDKFYIPLNIIPDGWTYEWKRHTLLGKEDPSYEVAVAQKGWEAVPRARHPEMMPRDHRGETIEREGMILMERPKEITDEAKARELRAARVQVRDKEVQLGAAPSGQFERDVHPQTKPNIKKSYEAIPIPDK